MFSLNSTRSNQVTVTDYTQLTSLSLKLKCGQDGSYRLDSGDQNLRLKK